MLFIITTKNSPVVFRPFGADAVCRPFVVYAAWTRDQLCSASIPVLRTRAQNLRDVLEVSEKDAVLPATRDQLVDLIMHLQERTVEPPRFRPPRMCLRPSPQKVNEHRRVAELGGYYLMPTEPVGSLPHPVRLQQVRMHSHTRLTQAVVEYDWRLLFRRSLRTAEERSTRRFCSKSRRRQ